MYVKEHRGRGLSEKSRTTREHRDQPVCEGELRDGGRCEPEDNERCHCIKHAKMTYCFGPCQLLHFHLISGAEPKFIPSIVVHNRVRSTAIFRGCVGFFSLDHFTNLQ